MTIDVGQNNGGGVTATIVVDMVDLLVVHCDGYTYKIPGKIARDDYIGAKCLECSVE